VSAPPIQTERDGRVAWIHLSRPTHNVLSRELNTALAAAVREHANDPEVTAIVIDGGDARGFSAGVEVADHTPDRVGSMLADFHGAVRAVWEAPCVTLAAVHGFALGGGLELAIACDLVIVEDDARLGFPEITLGCYPPVAAALLPARVGWARASEWVLGGETFDATTARASGLVNRTCASGTLREAVREFLAPFLARSPVVLREAKLALREGEANARERALSRIEERYLGSLMALADAEEGIRAFLEKRPPEFRNR
jgi:cyclohexa-1,5-dienecarbonyl-CoA hydratase